MVEDIYYISKIKSNILSVGPINEKRVRNLHEEENSIFER
jgi:hypothetical protein